MTGSHSRAQLLLKIIEMAYAAADDGEVVRSVFTALRELMSFQSGVFMPVNPDTLELQQGLCFDCSAPDMETYLAHYAPLDPFVLRQPSPAVPNQTMLFSDVITSRELGRSEFSEFMRKVPYHHALGILTGVAQQPVAVFSVHRQQHERDFCADDQAIFDCIGPHMARAITLRHQVKDPEQRAETGILVLGATGNALFLNTPARRFLCTTPPQMILAALPAQGSVVIKLGSQCFRLSRMPWATASLLRRFAMEDAAADPMEGLRTDEDPIERWSGATRQRAGTIIAVLQPFRPRVHLLRRLTHYGLSPRQSEIAVWALRGLANGEIARRLCIGEQTVKEHCQEIYHRVGVHTRVQFLAEVLGTCSLMPTGSGERCSQE
jgi:DNA-binding CsgD family transcriptional regulator